MESKEYTPDGWTKSGNHYGKNNGEPLHSEKYLHASINFYSRDGVKYYCAIVRGRQIFETLDNVLNFQKAVDFCESLLNAQNAP